MRDSIVYSILSIFSGKSMKHLKVGDMAPDFEALNEKGETVRLSDFKGKKLALFFYPADGTPGCTAEACNLRDHYTELRENGIEVLGVSPDTVKKHDNFSKKHQFPFSLLADEDLSVSKAYGIWGTKKFMGREYDGVHRTTFLIDEDGRIAHIIEKVETKNHAAQLMKAL